MFKVTRTISHYTKSCNVQFVNLSKFSSAPITAAIRNVEQHKEILLQSKKQHKDITPNSKSTKEGNSLVAAAFASLKDNKIDPSNESIEKASTVGELLSIADESGISRKRALKVVSLLAEWSSRGKVELSDFNTDPRFIKLCKILTKRNGPRKVFTSRNEDLSTIINITADDEAAKLITSISLPQTVKVMSMLTSKKRRSTPLLRSLAFNIAGNLGHLDLKQCSDLLYSSAVLNFIDENMLQKICTDFNIAIQETTRGSAVIGSVLTSLGHLQYKSTDILDAIADWMLKNNKICRIQDVCSLFIALGGLNYVPSNIEQLNEVLIPQVQEAEISSCITWLKFVWSLVVLNLAKPQHISSVLSENFITKIDQDRKSSIPINLRLLHIDSASKLLMKEYKGPNLPDHCVIKHSEISRTKDKLIMLNALQDTIGNLVNPKTHLKTNIYSGMGFYIDAELIFDSKCNPLPINTQGGNCIKVGVMALDFHDMCRGRVEPNGYNILSFRLLEAKGYRILPIIYTEFNPKDKLVNRVKYFETDLKRLVLH